MLRYVGLAMLMAPFIGWSAWGIKVFGWRSVAEMLGIMTALTAWLWLAGWLAFQ
jgi:hypothetical protein